jgi:hypothetical protein
MIIEVTAMIAAVKIMFSIYINYVLVIMINFYIICAW